MKNNKVLYSPNKPLADLHPMYFKKQNLLSTLPASSELYIETFKKDNPNKKYKKKYKKPVKEASYVVAYYVIATIAALASVIFGTLTYCKANDLHIIKKKT